MSQPSKSNRGEDSKSISPSVRESSPGHEERQRAAGGTESLGKKWQYLLLLFIGVHLFAVFAEPLRFFSRSNVQVSPDAELARNLVHPYTQFLYFDHGYFFFAPNPGPGHLIRILASPDPVPSLPDERDFTPLQVAKTLESADSKVVQLPDRNEQKPRLLYHRYFMLSEFYYGLFAPPDLAPEHQSDSHVEEQWKRDRSIYVDMKDSLHQYGKRVTKLDFTRVDRIERDLPDVNSTLKDKIRISDIRWQHILPEAFRYQSRPMSPPPNDGRRLIPSPSEKQPGGSPRRPPTNIPPELIPEGETIPAPK